MGHPSSRAPDPAAATFAALAGACVTRFLRQNQRPPLPDGLLADFTAQLWRVVNEAGRPPPLTGPEPGVPVEMPAERATELATQVFAGLAHPERRVELEVPARQLLKACLQPEFRRCRESYHEVADGVCRRQELKRALGRISGSHCVDCPYWTALSASQHATLLERAWVTGTTADFTARREVFLPEDFRALRVFLAQQARSG